VTLDLHATVGGEEVPGGTASGLSYRVGAKDLLEGIDEAVTGKERRRRHDLHHDAGRRGLRRSGAEVAVTVQAVNERELPAADDTWAETHRLRHLRRAQADVRSRLERMKKLEQGVQARDKVLERCSPPVDVPLPESVVEAEVEWRTPDTTQQLQQAGMTLDQYLESRGQGRGGLDEQLRTGATEPSRPSSCSTPSPTGRRSGSTTPSSPSRSCARAQRAGVAPDQYAQQVVQAGQLAGLVSEVRRGKALATVMEAAAITDSAGREGRPRGAARRARDPGRQRGGRREGRRYHVHDDGQVHYLDEGERRRLPVAGRAPTAKRAAAAMTVVARR
jgi:trigger factor